MKNTDKNSFYVIGLMSGTSLDGLDIAYCYFLEKDNNWHFEIFNAETVPYNTELKEKLGNCNKLSAKDFLIFHNEYGKWIGQKVNNFIKEHKINNIDFIASHGHTVFHEPDKNFNFQIGNPYFILKETQIPVVADFRTKNIVFDGQGAPLVPIGDRLLFGSYTFRINIGGFANISYENEQGKTIAFDICPANIIINLITREYFGQDMDKDGKIAQSGKIIPSLLNSLNNIDYYKQNPPKSLAKEWLDTIFLPKLTPYFDKNKPEDILRTLYEHIAMQITTVTRTDSPILLSGGGAKNKFLIELLKQKAGEENIIIPSQKIINFKESLIFAFLGILAHCDINNCYSSYTGSTMDMVCGQWYSL